MSNVEEKTYQEILKEQTEKAIKSVYFIDKEKNKDTVFRAATILFGGPVMVVVLMGLSLVACSLTQ